MVEWECKNCKKIVKEKDTNDSAWHWVNGKVCGVVKPVGGE